MHLSFLWPLNFWHFCTTNYVLIYFGPSLYTLCFNCISLSIFLGSTDTQQSKTKVGQQFCVVGRTLYIYINNFTSPHFILFFIMHKVQDCLPCFFIGDCWAPVFLSLSFFFLVYFYFHITWYFFRISLCTWILWLCIIFFFWTCVLGRKYKLICFLWFALMLLIFFSNYTITHTLIIVCQESKNPRLGPSNPA